MSRLALVDPANPPEAVRPLLDAVQKKLGRVPNMMRALANSPAALKSYLEFSGALASSSLDAKTRELIALTVGEVNDCTYCVAAHTAIGGKLGVPAQAMSAARNAEASDPKTAAILRFARALVVQRGNASDADLRALRAAGVTDTEIVDVIATTSLNVYTNWFNHVAAPVVDFPVPA